jgi:hypothetical protein
MISANLEVIWEMSVETVALRAETQGQITCYIRRAYHLLPTFQF